MAQTGKENLQRTPRFQGTCAELGRKESFLLAASALSSSKIPVLPKSRVLPAVKQLQQQDHLQQVCPSSMNSKGVKTPKMSCAASDPGVEALDPAAGLVPKSRSRDPLGEMQLSISGHRNVLEAGVSKGKDASTVEFLPDADALASILSNTGLTNQVVGATHKPSLARRVPLKGSRACSVSIGAGRGSQYKEAPAVNLVCMSHVTPKDMGPSRSSSLAMNRKQLKALSATLENLGPPGVATKPMPSMENLGAGKCQDSGARSKAECPSSVAEAGITMPSNSARKKETAGTSWQEEVFIPDPAAKASILSNVGLSPSALQANGKLSLAQRVPVKDAQKSLASTRDGNSALLQSRGMSAPPTGKFGRVSCRSTQGLKGLEKSDASRAQPVNTPSNRSSVLDFSPYGLARRVPVACSQSLRPSLWKCNHVLLSSCGKDKWVGAQCQTETPQVKWAGEFSPQTTAIVDSKQDDIAVPWENIAVRLFQDDLGRSARKPLAVPVITQEMGKLQRIERLAKLLQQEIIGGVDREVITPLEELHKLLSAHCLSAPKPDQCTTPLPDTSPNLCKQAPASPSAVAPELSAALAASSQQTVWADGLGHSVKSPSPRANISGDSAALAPIGQVRQRLDDLLQAPDRFYEACLNDECAFYTARVTSVSQPSMPRCKEPVAKMLDADDDDVPSSQMSFYHSWISDQDHSFRMARYGNFALLKMHFIPISVTTFTEAERSSPS